MPFLSTLKQLGIRQAQRAELVTIRMDVSLVSNGTNAGVLEGSKHVTVTKNATGDYTFTFNRTAKRAIAYLGGGVVGEAFLRLQAVPTTSVVRVIVEDDEGTDSDLDFEFSVIQYFDDVDR